MSIIPKDVEEWSSVLRRRFCAMNNRTSNPIEDELDVIRLKIYERIKDMTPEEEVAYFRAQNEPIIRQFNLKMSPLKPLEPRKRAKIASG